MRAYGERWPLGYSSAAWYGWRERPRGKSGAGEVEEVKIKIITKFWVNGESETAQAVSALPSPFGQTNCSSKCCWPVGAEQSSDVCAE